MTGRVIIKNRRKFGITAENMTKIRFFGFFIFGPPGD